MEQKYYTPTIEELCEGLEMEVLRPFFVGSGHDGAKFKPETFTLDQRIESWLHEFTIGCERVDPDKVRVKYLDKEDIEALGFIFEKIDSFHNYNTYAKGLWELQDWGNQQICIEQRWIGTEPVKNTIHFAGIIKNKSRLSLVMEMIGIKLDVSPKD